MHCHESAVEAKIIIISHHIGVVCLSYVPNHSGPDENGVVSVDLKSWCKRSAEISHVIVNVNSFVIVGGKFHIVNHSAEAKTHKTVKFEIVLP